MLQMLTIKDSKASIYKEPLFLKREIEIIDILNYSFQQEEYKDINANEYDIFKLGTYNESNGKFDLLEAPEHLYNVGDIIKQGEENATN